MKKSLIVVLLAAAVFFLGHGIADAWWSVPYYDLAESTHFNLGQAAIGLVAENEIQYRDIYKYKFLSGGRGIVPWMSGNIDDANAHGRKYEDHFGVTASDYDGGPIGRWWGLSTPQFNYPNDGVLPQYKAFNFATGDYSAYYYLAMMAHLVADQAVPAHAANIRHISPTYEFISEPTGVGDNLENAASKEQAPFCMGCHATAPVRSIATQDVTDYYSGPSGGIINSTQSMLPVWKSLNDQTYWIANSQYLYVGGAFDDKWGHYGGPCNYPSEPWHCDDLYLKGGDRYGLIERQLTEAVSYVSGILEDASRRLPPLVRNFEIPSATAGSLPAVIDMVDGTNISFQILENRDPLVWLTIKAKSKTPPYTEYFIKKRSWLSLEHVDQVDHPFDLPYATTYTLNSWRGELDGGGVLPNATYIMRIELEDSDGNDVNKV